MGAVLFVTSRRGLSAELYLASSECAGADRPDRVANGVGERDHEDPNQNNQDDLDSVCHVISPC